MPDEQDFTLRVFYLGSCRDIAVSEKDLTSKDCFEIFLKSTKNVLFPALKCKSFMLGCCNVDSEYLFEVYSDDSLSQAAEHLSQNGVLEIFVNEITEISEGRCLSLSSVATTVETVDNVLNNDTLDSVETLSENVSFQESQETQDCGEVYSNITQPVPIHSPPNVAWRDFIPLPINVPFGYLPGVVPVYPTNVPYFVYGEFFQQENSSYLVPGSYLLPPPLYDGSVYGMDLVFCGENPCGYYPEQFHGSVDGSWSDSGIDHNNSHKYPIHSTGTSVDGGDGSTTLSQFTASPTSMMSGGHDDIYSTPPRNTYTSSVPSTVTTSESSSPGGKRFTYCTETKPRSEPCIPKDYIEYPNWHYRPNRKVVGAESVVESVVEGAVTTNLSEKQQQQQKKKKEEEVVKQQGAMTTTKTAPAVASATGGLKTHKDKKMKEKKVKHTGSNHSKTKNKRMKAQKKLVQ